VVLLVECHDPSSGALAERASALQTSSGSISAEVAIHLTKKK
jgi:hypothetical protein